MISGMQAPVLSLAGDYALSFDDSQHLIGRMDMRSGPRALIEEDRNDFQFPTVLFRNQVMHVNHTLEMFRVRGSGDSFVGL